MKTRQSKRRLWIAAESRCETPDTTARVTRAVSRGDRFAFGIATNRQKSAWWVSWPAATGTGCARARSGQSVRLVAGSEPPSKASLHSTRTSVSEAAAARPGAPGHLVAAAEREVERAVVRQTRHDWVGKCLRKRRRPSRRRGEMKRGKYIFGRATETAHGPRRGGATGRRQRQARRHDAEVPRCPLQLVRGSDYRIRGA